MFEESTKLKLPRTANPGDIATLQNNTTAFPANIEPMLDSIFDDEDASTSTNQNYIIDVPDILEIMDPQDPDPISNTEEEQNTEENVLMQVPHMDFAHCSLEDESPHHQCTYSDCQVTGSMFFDNPSENVIQINAHISFIVSATLSMHHIHMKRTQRTYPLYPGT